MEVNESSSASSELTSTVESVLTSVGNEKKTCNNECGFAGDSVPSSSSDANLQRTTLKTIQDDPISSTSDTMTSRNDLNFNTAPFEGTVEPSGTSEVATGLVTDTDFFSSDLNIENISMEKISEDVEDIANDLENLLGETTNDYKVPTPTKKVVEPVAEASYSCALHSEQHIIKENSFEEMITDEIVVEQTTNDSFKSVYCHQSDTNREQTYGTGKASEVIPEELIVVDVKENMECQLGTSSSVENVEKSQVTDTFQKEETLEAQGTTSENCEVLQYSNESSQELVEIIKKTSESTCFDNSEGKVEMCKETIISSDSTSTKNETTQCSIEQEVSQITEETVKEASHEIKGSEETSKIIHKPSDISDQMSKKGEETIEETQEKIETTDETAQIIEETHQTVQENPHIIQGTPETIEEIPKVIEEVSQIIETIKTTPQPIERVLQSIEEPPQIVEETSQANKEITQIARTDQFIEETIKESEDTIEQIQETFKTIEETPLEILELTQTNEISKVSQETLPTTAEISQICEKIEEKHQTPKEIPQTIAKTGQKTEKTSQTIEELSQIIEEMPQAMEEISRIGDNIEAPLQTMEETHQVVEETSQPIKESSQKTAKLPRTVEGVHQANEKLIPLIAKHRTIEETCGLSGEIKATPHSTEETSQIVEEKFNISEEIEKQPHKIEETPQIIEDIPQTTEEVHQTIEEISQTVEETAQAMEEPDQTIEETPEAIEEVPQIIEERSQTIEETLEGISETSTIEGTPQISEETFEETHEIIEETPLIIEQTPQISEATFQTIEEIPLQTEGSFQITEERSELIEESSQTIKDTSKAIEELPETVEEISHMSEEIPPVSEDISSISSEPHQAVLCPIQESPTLFDVIPSTTEHKKVLDEDKVGGNERELTAPLIIEATQQSFDENCDRKSSFEEYTASMETEKKFTLIETGAKDPDASNMETKENDSIPIQEISSVNSAEIVDEEEITTQNVLEAEGVVSMQADSADDASSVQLEETLPDLVQEDVSENKEIEDAVKFLNKNCEQEASYAKGYTEDNIQNDVIAQSCDLKNVDEQKNENKFSEDAFEEKPADKETIAAVQCILQDENTNSNLGDVENVTHQSDIIEVGSPMYSAEEADKTSRETDEAVEHIERNPSTTHEIDNSIQQMQEEECVTTETIDETMIAIQSIQQEPVELENETLTVEGETMQLGCHYETADPVIQEAVQSILQESVSDVMPSEEMQREEIIAVATIEDAYNLENIEAVESIQAMEVPEDVEQPETCEEQLENCEEPAAICEDMSKAIEQSFDIFEEPSKICEPSDISEQPSDTFVNPPDISEQHADLKLLLQQSSDITTSTGEEEIQKPEVGTRSLEIESRSSNIHIDLQATDGKCDRQPEKTIEETVERKVEGSLKTMEICRILPSINAGGDVQLKENVEVVEEGTSNEDHHIEEAPFRCPIDESNLATEAVSQDADRMYSSEVSCSHHNPPAPDLPAHVEHTRESMTIKERVVFVEAEQSDTRDETNLKEVIEREIESLMGVQPTAGRRNSEQEQIVESTTSEITDAPSTSFVSEETSDGCEQIPIVSEGTASISELLNSPKETSSTIKETATEYETSMKKIPIATAKTSIVSVGEVTRSEGVQKAVITNVAGTYKDKKSLTNTIEELATSSKSEKIPSEAKESKTIAPLIIDIESPEEEKSEPEVSISQYSSKMSEKESLKMTITKHKVDSPKDEESHSILKIFDPKDGKSQRSKETIVPKLIIKPIVRSQGSPIVDDAEQTIPKLLIRNMSPNRPGSPKVSKIQKSEISSPLKLTIKPVLKSDESQSKSSPKLNIKPIVRLEEEPTGGFTPKITIKPIIKPDEEIAHSPKITIRPIIKPDEGSSDLLHSPRITIKPIPKPEIIIKLKCDDKEDVQVLRDEEKERSNSPRITIKPIVKPDEKSEEAHNPRITIKPISKPEEEECTPKITIKPIMKPQEDRHDKKEGSPKIKIKPIVKPSEAATIELVDYDDQIKQERIVLKINKTKESKKRSTNEDTEKLGKIKLKFSKEGRHAHIVPEQSKLKRALEDREEPESKRTRRGIEERDESENKRPRRGIEDREESENKRTKRALEDPEEPQSKRSKVETIDITSSPEASGAKDGSVIEINDDSCPQAEDPIEAIPVFEITPELAGAMKNSTAPVAQMPPAMPRKRGRPRKVPLVVREDFKDPKEEEPVPEMQPVAEETGTGRPKRSCRGPSVCTTLGIKPRKPRGGGATSGTTTTRGRGRGRGSRGGSRGGRQQRVSAAKLKLLQEEAAAAAAAALEVCKLGEEEEVLELLDDDIKEEELSSQPLPRVESAENKIHASNAPRTPAPAIDTLTCVISSDVALIEEETRMSAEINSSRAQTPAKQVFASGDVEDTQSSVQSTATSESVKARKGSRMEIQLHLEPDGDIISPDQLAEYFWGGDGPYMLQEQVAQFLGIKSFKRKYPGIQRRTVDMQERDFIRENGLASEAMCDMGLTAVNSADILDIMYSDFQIKYEEYCKHQRDRQAKEVINKQKALTLATSQEKNKHDLTQQAVQSAASWNTSFNKTRREERRACMDLQTFTVNYPRGKFKNVEKKTKVGSYPVALVPGQYTDHYKNYTPNELYNLPLNTMMNKPIPIQRDDESQSDGSESSSGSSSSDSDSSSSDSSDEECNICTPPGTAKKLLAN